MWNGVGAMNIPTNVMPPSPVCVDGGGEQYVDMSDDETRDSSLDIDSKLDDMGDGYGDDGEQVSPEFYDMDDTAIYRLVTIEVGSYNCVVKYM